MKRSRVNRVGAIGLVITAVALGLFAVPGTAAQDQIPGLIDITVDLTVLTPVVTPPAEALYHVSVGQGSVLGLAGDLTVTLPPGSAVSNLSDTAACAATGNVVSCDFGVTGGAFDITASTPTSEGNHLVSATVAADPASDPLGLEYTPNNTDTATVNVTSTSSSGRAAGVVKRGSSISLTLGGRQFSLSVPATSDRGEEGVIVSIEGEAATGHLCADGTCRDGFEVGFDNSHPPYTWTDETNPLVTLQVYPTVSPCYGFGGPCLVLDFTKDTLSSLTPLVPVPACVGQGGSGAGNGESLPGSPCINQKFKATGSVTFDVRMTSDDPIYLPIGKVG